ncbi:MAG TPA: DUF433 domain-containing protein [Gemmatimonadales bacterium]|nr:DUF433 domain-containing protein [Gemmatimonadales bacterium]
MPRSRSPIRHSPDLHGGKPVFAGSTIPVEALLESVRKGESIDRFLERFPELSRDQVTAVLAHALSEVIERERVPPAPPQGSLLPRLDDRGAIMNAADLRPDQVVGKKVLCPACRLLVFKTWPEGWDAHAEHKCPGITANDPVRRKSEYKRRYGYLFRER